MPTSESFSSSIPMITSPFISMPFLVSMKPSSIFFSEGELERIEARNKPGKKPLPQSKMVQARKFVEEYAYRISEKWYQFFVLKADIVLEKITKELK